ncbi:MAG: hypothetical protein HYX74_09205 [Acidobacteria bacterium]|nr:hypothetical protein [Acidobacteriota bacterium]
MNNPSMKLAAHAGRQFGTEFIDGRVQVGAELGSESVRQDCEKFLKVLAARESHAMLSAPCVPAVDIIRSMGK